MIDATALVQLKAFAHQDGAILALAWTASFALIVYSPQYSLGNLLALATPFIVGWRLSRFRDYALGGLISFRRGFAFSCYTFFYASLAFALVQYLYFTFLDNGRMEDMLDNTIRVMTPIYKEQGISPKELNAAAEVITSLSPIYIAITFMMQNLFIGLLLSLPVALLGRRSKPRL